MFQDEPFVSKIVEGQLADLENSLENVTQHQTSNIRLIKDLQQIYQMKQIDPKALEGAKKRVLQHVKKRDSLETGSLPSLNTISPYPNVTKIAVARSRRKLRRLYLFAAILLIGCLSLGAIFFAFPQLHLAFPSANTSASLAIDIEPQPFLYQNAIYINSGSDIRSYAVGNGTLKHIYKLPNNLRIDSPEGNTPDNIIDFTIINSILYMSSETSTSATRLSDGEVLWQAPFGTETSRPPTIMDGVFYGVSYETTNQGFTSKSIYALRTSDGKLLWQYRIENQDEIPNSPLIIQNVIYFTSSTQLYHAIDARIYALNGTDGTLLWEHTIGHAAISDLQTDGTNLYVFVDGFAEAFRAQDGGEIWRYKLPVSSILEMHNTFLKIVAHGTVYIAAGNGSIYALQAISGTLLWRYQDLYGTLFGAFSVQGDVVYIGMLAAMPTFQARTSFLIALQKNDGRLLWKISLGKQELLAPSIGQGVIYVASNPKGNSQESLFAFRATDGLLLWQRILYSLS